MAASRTTRRPADQAVRFRRSKANGRAEAARIGGRKRKRAVEVRSMAPACKRGMA